jgi:hypothetical protein
MHDFGLTENYVALYDQPIVFDMDAMNHGQKIPWVRDRQRPNRVGFFPRAGGASPGSRCRPRTSRTRSTRTTTAATSSSISWSSPRPSASTNLRPARRRFWRWTIDRTRGTVLRTQLDDRPQEFPRVPDAQVSRKHRYGYTAATADFVKAYGHGSTPSSAFGNGLVNTACPLAARSSTGSHGTRARARRFSSRALAPTPRTTATSCPTCTTRPERLGPGDPRGAGLHRRPTRPNPPAEPDPARTARELDRRRLRELPQRRRVRLAADPHPRNTPGRRESLTQGSVFPAIPVQ